MDLTGDAAAHESNGQSVLHPARAGADTANASGWHSRDGIGRMLLDELDYGTVLLSEEGRIVHLNRAARRELKECSHIAIADGMLRARTDADARRLARGLADARRGLRSLVMLGGEPAALGMALIPIVGDESASTNLIAAIFGRRRLCEPISVDCFARAHGLTDAEARVIKLLCQGLDPDEIAVANGVSLCTVRSQIHSARDKTGAASIRALVAKLAALPPLIDVLLR